MDGHAQKFAYYIDREHGVALIRLRGEVDGSFIASCAHTLTSDPAWSDEFATIWDERGIDVLDVSPEGLDEMVDAQTDGQSGHDIVISTRGPREIVLRLYAIRTRARGRPATVCHTMERAFALANLDAAPPHLEAWISEHY